MRRTDISMIHQNCHFLTPRKGAACFCGGGGLDGGVTGEMCQCAVMKRLRKAVCSQAVCAAIMNIINYDISTGLSKAVGWRFG